MENIIYSVGGVIVALGILIVFHEFGHYLFARLSGVGVITFSVGFGPKVWVKKKGETEYALSAFPLGGYVKMVGEDPAEELKEVDIEKSFSHKSLLKRFAIVFAGPAFNLVLAVILLMIVFLFYGVPVLSNIVGATEEGGPAAKAGIVKGDRIVAIDGNKIDKWDDLSKTIKQSGGKPLKFQLQRDGKDLDVVIEPVRKETRDVFGQEKVDWMIGIGSQVEIEKGDPGLVVWRAIVQTYDYAKITLVGLYKMVTREISPRNLGGPILIAQMAGQQAQEGFGAFLAFLAVLSINLGVLNLLPVPVLDGGHLFFFLIEAVIGRPVSIRSREVAQQVGIVLLMLLMMYAFANDILRLFETRIGG